MKEILSFLTACFLCIGAADAAVRTTNATARNSQTTQSQNVTIRNDTPSVSSRTAETNGRATITGRDNNGSSRAVVSRTANTVTPRTVTRNNTSASRSAINVGRTTNTRNNAHISRAATESVTFGSGYNTCRDAYFTCMDQFCATADDAYRRCMCSSRLDEIKLKQRALGEANDQIQNFKELNIEAIPKTAAEVNAMLTASTGEYTASIAKDVSASTQKLAGISSVLAQTKSKSLSMAGTLDIAGDINSIWATTDLANGVNIANLTGETLYNAVHSQCVNLVEQHCESKSTLNMVVAAYGMYIENDCTILATALDKKKTSANATIRETEHEMYNARLENYNAHNSTSINDCVAKVRKDVTADTACGTDYVHCLDISGLYLNRITGEPIYTADFYKLETMLSLSGDVLTNQTNRMLVAELNRKRNVAEISLSTCQDLADDVWDEFMRQAIVEIYQGQQSRIRQVKDECLDVVNKCYDSQTASLRDFSNTKEQLLLGAQLELSEELCRSKLDACSNLYGGGTDGMAELIATMRNITNQKIAQNCFATLKEYAVTLCSPTPNDTLHAYPYSCRVYAPGEQKYALNWSCQNATSPLYDTSAITTSSTSNGTRSQTQSSPSSGTGTPSRNATVIAHPAPYTCSSAIRRYTSCKAGYYLSECEEPNSNALNLAQLWRELDAPVEIIATTRGNQCRQQGREEQITERQNQNGVIAPGGNKCPYVPKSEPPVIEKTPEICPDYVGSLYQKIVRYALQACMRPSETQNIQDNTTPISKSVLQDVNATMDSIRVSMSKELQSECERLGGYWVSNQHEENSDAQSTGSNLNLYNRFYKETGANDQWGYCARKSDAQEYYGDTIEEDEE